MQRTADMNRCSSRVFRPKARAHDPPPTPGVCGCDATKKTKFRFDVSGGNAAFAVTYDGQVT
jgi:hypothetical protein